MFATGHYLNRFLELTYAQVFGFSFLHIKVTRNDSDSCKVLAVDKQGGKSFPLWTIM